MAEQPGNDTAPEVPGDWAVDHETCMACGSPPLVAPDLMGFGKNHAEGSSTQCYFKRQPSTAEEVARACKAAEASCCAAVRYNGRDPALRAAMASIDAAGLLPESLATLEAKGVRARLNGRRLLLAFLLSTLVLVSWFVATARP